MVEAAVKTLLSCLLCCTQASIQISGSPWPISVGWPVIPSSSWIMSSLSSCLLQSSKVSCKWQPRHEADSPGMSFYFLHASKRKYNISVSYVSVFGDLVHIYISLEVQIFPYIMCYEKCLAHFHVKGLCHCPDFSHRAPWKLSECRHQTCPYLWGGAAFPYPSLVLTGISSLRRKGSGKMCCKEEVYISLSEAVSKRNPLQVYPDCAVPRWYTFIITPHISSKDRNAPINKCIK